MNITVFIIITIIAALLAGLCVYLVVKMNFAHRLGAAQHELEFTKASYEERIARSEEQHKSTIEELRRQNEDNLRRLKENYDSSLKESKENNEKSLKQQIEAVKAQIAAESEKVLKARQEEFTKKAEESFNTIAGDVNKNLKNMSEAFEANKKAQTDTSAELRTQIGEAVKNLKDQTKNVGEKGDTCKSVGINICR